jgi:putative membrane-bound dehydrogenase-like protein
MNPRPRRGPPRAVVSLILAALGGLALAWLLAYFVLGVTPRFVAGLVRSALSPGRTLANISAPPGVTVSAWAIGLSAPTALRFGPDGRLYVAQINGQIIALADRNGDGSAEERTVFASGFPSPLGLAFDGADLFVGRRGGITRLTDRDGDGAADQQVTIVDGLPALRHQTDGLAFGPDGRLYIGQGSTSDRGETGILAMEASILVVERDGSGLRVFASGTRNPYGLAFMPGTDLLFASDNGRDVPASGVPDEINLILEGGRYGWTDCWGFEQGSNCAGTIAPVAELEAHGAAGGLVFYTGEMFPEWRGSLFVTLYGSNSGDPDIGRKVQRVELVESAQGWAGTVHDFAAGLDRPLDVTVGSDGALYVADFGAGAIYRFGR